MAQPLAVPSLPSAMAAANPEDPTKIRIGRVVALDRAQVTVAIADTVIATDAAYLAPYVPVLGDYVQVAWQGGAPLVLGALSGAPPDNMVTNWSFENSLPGVGAPTGWGIWTVAGTATTEVATVTDGFELHGRQAAKITVTSAGGTTRLYSAQVAVEVGQMWSAGAQVAVFGAGTDTVTAGLFLAWQANTGDTPPTYVSLETVATQDFAGKVPFWYQLRGGGAMAGKVAPAGVAWVRVILSVATGAANSAAMFDRITLRQIS